MALPGYETLDDLGTRRRTEYSNYAGRPQAAGRPPAAARGNARRPQEGDGASAELLQLRLRLLELGALPVPGRCGCRGCADGTLGAYTQLVHAAKADQDAAHRQLAMDAISIMAPVAGGDGTPAADIQAAPVLACLYPMSLTSDVQAAVPVTARLHR